MNKEFTLKDGFGSFYFCVLIYLAVQFVSALVLTNAETGSLLYWIVLAVGNLSIGFSAWAYSKIAKVGFLSGTKFDKKPQWAHILWSFLVIIGLVHFMTPINNWLCDLIEKIGLNRPSVDIPMQIAPLIIVVSIIPAFSEEAMFRGVLGNGLSQLGMWKGALIGGALFSLFHLNPAQTLHQFALGTFFVILVYRSGSLWTSVIAHLFNNVLVVILSLYVDPTGFYQNNAAWVCLAGLAVSALSLFGYFKTTKNIRRDYQAEDNVAVDKFTWIFFGVAAACCVGLWVVALFS